MTANTLSNENNMIEAGPGTRLEDRDKDRVSDINYEYFRRIANVVGLKVWFIVKENGNKADLTKI